MAKRKRLTPAQSPAHTPVSDDLPRDLETKSLGFPAVAPRAPIAQVSGDAAQSAALEELASEITKARAEGRLVQALPVEIVDIGYLQRDRITAHTDELAELMASIKARGQQTPIEVVEQDAGGYGLISGWRRLTALRQLWQDTGDDRFSTVQALIRQPNSTSDAYVAMVEENEIRLGLSYYERARIVAKAVEAGAYSSEKEALQSLFSTASRAKRSKIKSFLVLYHAADDLLRFPSRISERLGLSLSRAIEDDAAVKASLRKTLTGQNQPSPEEEIGLLQTLASAPVEDAAQESKSGSKSTKSDTDAEHQSQRQAQGIKLDAMPNKLVLHGPGVTYAFKRRLQRWLEETSER